MNRDFPGRRKKALTFGFDDCEQYDRKLAELFRTYKVKATFFLITDSLGAKIPFHRYGRDTVVERVTAKELPVTYRGMELASHTASHHDCRHMDYETLKSEMERSCAALGGSCKDYGMAYPGGLYHETCVKYLKELGVPYARTAVDTHRFAVPRTRDEFLAWNSTCQYHDPDIEAIVEEFLREDGTRKLLYIWGHSYETESPDPAFGFAAIEALLKKLGGREDIWYASNMDIYREEMKWEDGN